MPIDVYMNFPPDPKRPAPKEDIVATPEGDNEFGPDQPLRPLPEGAEQEPREANEE